MVSNKPWFNRLLHETGDFFCFGIVGGSAFNMSPKGERFIRGLQAVRVNAPLCASYCAVWGGLTSVFESSMKYVRQKDDPWTSILSDVAAAGLLKMRRGLGPSLSSSLIVSSTMELVEGYLVGQNRVASNLQFPQPNFEELHKKQKRGGIKGLCYGYISVPIGPSIGGAPVADRHPPKRRAPGVHYGHPYGDAEDHISWLLQHGWHEKALEAVEAGKGRSELVDEVGSRYLDHLIVERKYAEAASLCPKLLRGSASAWERWVFHFAHLRQLPVLVPYMPTENPRLRDTAYEVALVALATNPYFHKDLLSTVKSWPPVIYSVLPVISAIEPQLSTSSMTDALKEALAQLYVIDGQHEKAFALYADLMKPDVFYFIEKHNLHDAIREKVAQLMMIDCKRAIPLLIQHRDLISPQDVVSQLMAANNTFDFRYFLHLYLHSLFESYPDAGKDFHDMQVELYADYDTKMLLPFLRSSQHYTLEKAYDICVKRDLLREQVFILGRMGNSKQALSVIINKLGDIEEAIEFVSMQHDDDLWEELIKQCLNKPEMVGVLLEHTVGNLDPLYIVNMVPNGLEIPRLRDRLVKIITDYRTETSLRNGCNDILKADCVNLLIKYYKEARRAIYLSNEEDEARSKRDKNWASQFAEKSLSMKSMEVKSKTRGGARCCVCFDPFSIQNVSVIAFFCCHAYHKTCLVDSTISITQQQKKPPTPTKSSDELSYYEYDNGDAEDDEEEDTSSGSPKMRCILCTTAAG